MFEDGDVGIVVFECMKFIVVVGDWVNICFVFSDDIVDIVLF